MKPDLQRRVQRYGWDRAAAHYEPYWQRQLEPAHDLLLEQARLEPGQHVVDVACGTGLVTLRAAAQVGPQGRVTGFDISAKMIDAAEKAAASAGLANATFARGEAEALDVDQVAGFDAALCSLGLMYVPDPSAALATMSRSLRPGGRAVVAVWGERRNCGWASIFPIVDARVESDVCPLFFALGSGGVLRETMERVGFVDVDEHRLDTTLTYATAEHALGAAFLGGPVALAYSRFDDDTRSAVHSEYLESIRQFRDGVGYHIPGEFVIVSGLRP